MPFSHPTYGGNAIWSYSLIQRANRAKNAIQGLYFIQDHPYQKEAEECYSKLVAHLDDSISKRKFNDWQDKMGSIKESEKIDAALMNFLLIRHGDKPPIRNFEKQDERTIALAKKQKDELLESNFDKDLLKLLIEI